MYLTSNKKIFFLKSERS